MTVIGGRKAGGVREEEKQKEERDGRGGRAREGNRPLVLYADY